MAQSPAQSGNFDKTALAKLKKLIARKSNALTWHHAVGALVAQLVPKGANNHGKMKRLVEITDAKNKRVTIAALNAARDFSRSVPKRDLKTLEGLSFAHVGKLLTIRTNKRRYAFYLRKCQVEKWSFRRLDAEIKAEFGSQSPGGRPVKVAEIGPVVALGNVLWLRDAWRQKHAPALQCNLEHQRATLRPPSIEKWTGLIAAVGAALDKLCEAAEKAQRRLREVQAKTPRKSNKTRNTKSRRARH